MKEAPVRSLPAKHVRKLLGGKAYHSIGHLPGSRVGPGDHHLPDGEAELFTSRWETALERVVVTEKLDGTCVAVLRTEAGLLPVNREGYPVSESPWQMHHLFGDWVEEREDVLMAVLAPGDLLVGEWMAQAHGIVYDRLPSLFFAFDLKRGKAWIPTMQLFRLCAMAGIETVPLISYGPPLDPSYFKRVTKRSAFRSKGPAEGIVLRRETDEKRLAIAKWVREDHEPGIYLPETENAVVSEPIWHRVYEGGAV